jgi:hypothetical protein
VRRLAVLLLAAAAIAAPACGTPPKSRCERTCVRMAQCSRELKHDPPFETSECIDECGKLELQSATRALVGQHVRCVDEAADCQKVMECP